MSSCYAVDGVADEVLSVLIELVGVAARQQLRVAGHHAQRFLKVVGGDVGELLELLIGAPQLSDRLVQRRLHGLELGEIRDRSRETLGSAVVLTTKGKTARQDGHVMPILVTQPRLCLVDV
jgi:hypothetical protein